MPYTANLPMDKLRYGDNLLSEFDNYLIDADGFDDAVELVKGLEGAVLVDEEYYSLLDWDSLSKIENVYGVDAFALTRDGMNDRQALLVENYLAFYRYQDNSIIIMPQGQIADTNTMAYALIHETCHALVNKKKVPQCTQLAEGVTDDIAFTVCRAAEIDIIPAYQFELIAVHWLYDLFGKTEVIKAVKEDTLVDLIDGVLGDGMTEKLNYAILLSKDGSIDATYAELEMLCDCSAKMGKSDIGRKRLKIFKEVYGEIGLDINEKHFAKLLKN